MKGETLTDLDADWVRRAIETEIAERMNEAWRSYWEEEERRILLGGGHLGTLDIKRGGLFPRKPSAEDAKLIAVGNEALRSRSRQ